jgi:hypothetical protein
MQRSSYELEQKPISSKTALTSCQEWIRETNIMKNYPDLLSGLGQATRGCVVRGRGEPEKKLEDRTETNIIKNRSDLLSGVDQATRGCVRGRESQRRS